MKKELREGKVRLERQERIQEREEGSQRGPLGV